MALAATSATAAQAAAFAILTPTSGAQAERTVVECSRLCPAGCGALRQMNGAAKSGNASLLSKKAHNVSLRRLPSRSLNTRATVSTSQDVAQKPGESSGTQEKTKYHFVVANSQFMLGDEEHFQEQMRERLRHFKDQGREQDFWLVHEPAFLDTMPDIGKRVKRPCTALVSTDGPWILFMKLRLDRVIRGEFEGPSEDIPEPLASKAEIGEFEVLEPEKWVAPYPKYRGEWWKPFLPPQ